MTSKKIVIDGLISSGKSVILQTLKDGLESRGYKVVLVKEPVDKWSQKGENGEPSLLERFYADPKRWGYHFQTKAFHDRVVKTKDLYSEHGESVDFYIMERSCFTDTLFMEMLHSDGLIDDMEMKDYYEWWNLWSEVMPFYPDLFIYLRPDVDVCMDRLRERNRNGESGVSKNYQLSLQKKHDEFFESDHIETIFRGQEVKIPRVIFETNENFRDDENVKSKVVDKFLSFVGK